MWREVYGVMMLNRLHFRLVIRSTMQKTDFALNVTFVLQIKCGGGRFHWILLFGTSGAAFIFYQLSVDSYELW